MPNKFTPACPAVAPVDGRRKEVKLRKRRTKELLGVVEVTGPHVAECCQRVAMLEIAIKAEEANLLNGTGSSGTLVQMNNLLLNLYSRLGLDDLGEANTPQASAELDDYLSND